MNKKLNDLILKEKMSATPNKQKIQYLQMALDKGLSIDVFRQSGTIHTKENFISKYQTPPRTELKSTEVIEYLDGGYIQMFPDGMYGVYDETGFLMMSYKLNDLEEILFKKFNNE